MITPSNEGGVGVIAGLVKGGWENLTSQVKKRSKDRNQHFAAGHQGAGGMSTEHLGTLIEGALKLDTQRHTQGLERFRTANEASKPGKSIGFSAQGDVNISEVHPPQVKEPKAPKQETVTAPATKPKKPKIRPTRRGGTY